MPAQKVMQLSANRQPYCAPGNATTPDPTVHMCSMEHWCKVQ